jgi:predicted enzyme related to lactoylglutathione lyase
MSSTTAVEGEWVDRVVGPDDVRVEVAFVRTPDGHGRLELNAPANTFGLRRIMFAVDDVDAVIARMRAHGAELSRAHFGHATMRTVLA